MPLASRTRVPTPRSLGGTGPRGGIRVWSPSTLWQRSCARRGDACKFEKEAHTLPVGQTDGVIHPGLSRTRWRLTRDTCPGVPCHAGTKYRHAHDAWRTAAWSPNQPPGFALPRPTLQRGSQLPHLPKGQPEPPAPVPGLGWCPTYCDVTQVRPAGLPTAGLEAEGPS